MNLSPAAREHLFQAFLGLGLGFCLSFIGFSSFEEVHRMFLLEDPRLLLTFAGAVALSAVGFLALRRSRPLPARPFHRGAVPGGVLVGVGWALCGACPGIVLVQLGEGKLWAVVILMGMLLGNALNGWLQANWLRWDARTCAE